MTGIPYSSHSYSYSYTRISEDVNARGEYVPETHEGATKRKHGERLPQSPPIGTLRPADYALRVANP